MEKRLFLFIIIFISLFEIAFSQTNKWNIYGVIKSDSTGIPLQSASVFISNSSKGTSTDAEGKFTISGLSNGNYNLIISYIGFEAQIYPIVINDKNSIISIRMKPASDSLTDVVIQFKKGDRQEELKVFRKEFLGNDKNAKQTTINNEEKLHLYYNSSEKILTGHSNEILEITNDALGYHIKYILKEFSFNKKSGEIHYVGYPFFEEMKSTSKSDEDKWESNRQKIYQSSALRFYRTLGKRNLIQQGYIIGNLALLANQDANTKGTILKGGGFSLTIAGQKYEDTLYWPEVPYYSLMTALPGHKYKLNFKGFLTVDASSATGSPHEFTNYQPGNKFSVLSLKQPVTINENGLPEDPSSIIYYGFWMDSRISDLLPFDYKPGQ